MPKYKKTKEIFVNHKNLLMNRVQTPYTRKLNEAQT